jgi:DNA-binding response OmpR family regulator
MATILLVEDEPNIAAIILFKLRREGHLVDCVETAAAARGAGATWDLVLLDSSLPGEDALALLGELREHAPVVVMTESRDDSTPDIARSMGAAAIVPKPFKPTVLARVVAEIVAARKSDEDHSPGNIPGGLMGTMTAEAAR